MTLSAFDAVGIASVAPGLEHRAGGEPDPRQPPVRVRLDVPDHPTPPRDDPRCSSRAENGHRAFRDDHDSESVWERPVHTRGPYRRERRELTLDSVCIDSDETLSLERPKRSADIRLHSTAPAPLTPTDRSAKTDVERAAR